MTLSRTPRSAGCTPYALADTETTFKAQTTARAANLVNVFIFYVSLRVSRFGAPLCGATFRELFLSSTASTDKNVSGTYAFHGSRLVVLRFSHTPSFVVTVCHRQRICHVSANLGKKITRDTRTFFTPIAAFTLAIITNVSRLSQTSRRPEILPRLASPDSPLF